MAQDYYPLESEVPALARDLLDDTRTEYLLGAVEGIPELPHINDSELDFHNRR